MANIPLQGELVPSGPTDSSVDGELITAASLVPGQLKITGTGNLPADWRTRIGAGLSAQQLAKLESLGGAGIVVSSGTATAIAIGNAPQNVVADRRPSVTQRGTFTNDTGCLLYTSPSPRD